MHQPTIDSQRYGELLSPGHVAGQARIVATVGRRDVIDDQAGGELIQAGDRSPTDGDCAPVARLPDGLPIPFPSERHR